MLRYAVQRLRETPGQIEKLAAADTHPAAGHAWGPAGAASLQHEAGSKPAGSAGLSVPSTASRRSKTLRAGRQEPVVVVGSGPAGLFAALTLAEAGIKVGSDSADSAALGH
jgi:NADPH-dependent 2,4-dienoyl-CoA reductase/sulfur reductase-like enzyme